MNAAMYAYKLAGLVLDWAGWDVLVADKGWDGGSNEANWERTKKLMIDCAKSIIEGREPNEDVAS